MKRIAKTILHLLCKLLVAPLVLLYKLFSLHGPNDSLFCSLGQFLSLFPGKIGSYVRVAFYTSTLPRVTPNLHIDFGSYFAHPEVEVGENVYIGAYCIVGKCTIGRQTLIGSFVNILSGNRQHHFSDTAQPPQQQGGTYMTVNIGENCWLGNNSVIMADIGNQCIIGAGSVVVKSIRSYSVAVGNPCKAIRDHNRPPIASTMLKEQDDDELPGTV